ncbi:MAG TPA: AtpZ/AtpI family protein [Candidatus Limnocylindrales bacterium]|nr:AtpZ/AtpI family protein [Candidatus Limnocylindrales bacterium]
MKDWGRAGAYVALFSEIAAIFLITTLVGLTIGWWVDRQLATLPIFLLVGALGGFGIGGVGVARLIDRFLARYR